MKRSLAIFYALLIFSPTIPGFFINFGPLKEIRTPLGDSPKEIRTPLEDYLKEIKTPLGEQESREETLRKRAEARRRHKKH